MIRSLPLLSFLHRDRWVGGPSAGKDGACSVASAVVQDLSEIEITRATTCCGFPLGMVNGGNPRLAKCGGNNTIIPRDRDPGLVQTVAYEIVR